MTLDWDDIRYFVASANGGSTLAASRVLGVSQTTVARRLDQMEQRLAVRLFERHSGGYRLTAAGTKMLEDADAVAWDVADFLTLFPACRGPVTGLFRLVVEEPLARSLVMPAVDAIRRQLPLVQWELVAKGASGDVAAATDLAVHLVEPPRQAGIAHRVLTNVVAWGAFSRADQPWRRLDAEHLELRHASGLAALIARVRRGDGVAVLPVCVGQAQTGLARCAGQRSTKRTPLWISYPERRAPAMMIDLLSQALEERLAAPASANADTATWPRVRAFPAIASAA